MSRSLARRGLSALLTLACAAAAFLVALDAPAPTRAPAFALTGAGGALTLANDRHGAAILQAGDLRPGDVAEGVVTLSADRDVALSLRSQPGVELAGAGGGLLSDRIALAIDDVTVPAAPAPVYSGPLAELRELALAGLAGGEPRRYRFRAMFPAGAGDNAYQGASLTTAFEWTAVAPTPAPPDPDPPARSARERSARRRRPRETHAGRARRGPARRPAGGARLRQAAPLPRHRQAARGRQGEVDHRVPRRQARARDRPQGPQGPAQPQGAKRARVRSASSSRRPPAPSPSARRTASAAPAALTAQRVGSLTTVTKNSSIWRTTSMNRSKSTGLVTYAFACSL